MLRTLRGRICWEAENGLDIEMRDEELGIRAREDDHPDVVVLADAFAESRELAKQLERHHVHRGASIVARATPPSTAMRSS